MSGPNGAEVLDHLNNFACSSNTPLKSPKHIDGFGVAPALRVALVERILAHGSV
jgi:hypothetical protein